MAGFTMGSVNDEPVQIVRTIARISQMIIELRDEYVQTQREDVLDQIERRLDELNGLHEQLRTRRARNSAE
jgi:hypothetical protein